MTLTSENCVSPAALENFCAAALQSTGISHADALLASDVLVTTDTMGVFTHGTKLLNGYIRRLQGGGLDAGARPEVAREGPAWANVDGHSALAMVTSVFAMQTAMRKARVCGIGFVGVHNSCHFGAAGYYASLAARQGFIGLAMANDIPSVAAPGSRGAVTGSNPFAYAIPAARHPPILLDMAISTVAGGKVYAARALGQTIPYNWLIDAQGQPTTDPGGFPQVGALMPMAAHKGYGLALLIESLAGVLTGAQVTWQIANWMESDASRATGHGAAFIAVDVSAFMARDKFEQRVAGVIDEIHRAPRRDDVERIYVPGEMEWEKRERALIHGIALPADVRLSLQAAAQATGLDLEKFLH